MKEITRFKIAMNADKELHQEYLRILDIISVNGEITPEMTTYAANKLGYSVSIEDIEKEEAEGNFSDDEFYSVCGGDNASAPDGRRIGCPMSFYISWTDYWIRNEEGKCPMGGRHSVAVSGSERICTKCRLSLGERGVIDIYDKNGNEIK